MATQQILKVDLNERNNIHAAMDIDAQAKKPIAKTKVSKSKLRAVDPIKVQKTLDATQLYLNEIGFSPLLSAEEEVYFSRRALKGEEAARKRMI
jgi:RNA polymerase nonessential primary-like sigma factor